LTAAHDHRRVELTTGETKVTTAAFVVDNVRELIFASSQHIARPLESNALAGECLGNIYAFVYADPIGIVGMRFYLDDPDASGAYFHRAIAPYDFIGHDPHGESVRHERAAHRIAHDLAVAEFGAGGRKRRARAHRGAAQY
jgi:hypothetical protein